MTEIGLNELLAELERARQAGDGEGFTRRQVQEAVGCGENKARRLIEALIEQGKARPARIKIQSRLTGTATTVQGYKLVEEA